MAQLFHNTDTKIPILMLFSVMQQLASTAKAGMGSYIYMYHSKFCSVTLWYALHVTETGQNASNKTVKCSQ